MHWTCMELNNNLTWFENESFHQKWWEMDIPQFTFHSCNLCVKVQFYHYLFLGKTVSLNVNIVGPVTKKKLEGGQGGASEGEPGVN